MTDPRIAALAEALAATMERPESGVAWPTRWTHDDFAWVARQLASPLLAALPPDWGGHDDLVRAYSVMQEAATERKAEIARLRKIEEAARAVLVELDIIRAHRPGGDPLIVHIDTHADLRAALEAEG